MAFAHNSYLLFPFDEGTDTSLNQKMAFDQIKTVLLDRLNKLFNHGRFAAEMQRALNQNHS